MSTGCFFLNPQVENNIRSLRGKEMVFETAEMQKSTVTENADCGDGGGDGSGCKPRQQWRPPPPFLTKTFEMVDDPQINSIISWNSTGTGFIIWDLHKFSSEVLPRTFRTNNISSFVYQLNNYGFKKVSWEQCEYANQWFQVGKKHWLKNIKRRNQQSQVTNKRPHFTPGNDLMNALMTEQNKMECKIQQLTQRLEDMEDQLAGLQAKTRLPEIEDEQMTIPALLEKFMHYIRKKKDEASGDNSKRPRLDCLSSKGNLDIVPQQKLFSIDDDDDPQSFSVQDKDVNGNVEDPENGGSWKKMMEELARGQCDLAADHAKAIVELDEMMASDIAMQREIMTAQKPSDADVEEDCHLQLWT